MPMPYRTHVASLPARLVFSAGIMMLSALPVHAQSSFTVSELTEQVPLKDLADSPFNLTDAEVAQRNRKVFNFFGSLISGYVGTGAVRYQWRPANWPASTRATVAPVNNSRLGTSSTLLFASADGQYQVIRGPFTPSGGLYVHRNGQSTLLPYGFEGSRINNAGQLIGFLYEQQANKRTAAVWQAGQLTTVSMGAYASGEVIDINDAGLMVGFVVDASGVKWPARWLNGQPQVINTGSADNFAAALSVNDAGTILIVSVNVTVEGFVSNPAFWLMDSQQRLTAVQWGGQASGDPGRLNNLGQVYATVDNKPSIWKDGKVEPVQTYLSRGGTRMPAGYTVREVLAMNNKGSMVVRASAADLSSRVFRFTAKP